jgi:hypothetical protein
MALESSFGWRGVCVEASDPHFAALELSRPNCYNAHACLASIPNQTVDFALDHAVLINGGKEYAVGACILCLMFLVRSNDSAKLTAPPPEGCGLSASDASKLEARCIAVVEKRNASSGPATSPRSTTT